MSKVVFKTEWFYVEEVTVDTLSQPFYKILVEDTIIILALTKENKLILVKQFRPALEKYTLEFPSGSIDKNEKPLDAIKRELYEETGYRCSRIKILGKNLYPVSSRMNGKIFLTIGLQAERDVNFIAKEEIEVTTVSKSQFIKLVRKEEFGQVSALATVALAQWNNYI